MTLSLPRPRPNVAALPTYSRAVSAPVRFRAGSNESPFGPGPAVVRAMRQACADPHLYPTLTGDLLAAALESHLDLPPEQILVGGGSLALLQHALTSFAGPGDEVVHAWRSYEAYPIVIGVAGATSVKVPLDNMARHDVDAMLTAITPRTRVVIICNPNNPTGTALEPDELERLVAGIPSDVLVLLDEAYREFDPQAVETLPWLTRLPNLVILRTFSKAYGLAGLRAGYAVGTQQVLDTIRKVTPPFGLNRVAEAAAVVALSERDHLAHTVSAVRAGRDRVRAELARMGIWTPASAANYIWLPCATQVDDLAHACAAAGVGVRAFAGEGVRFTVGTSGAEQEFLAAARSLIM
ncbi:histidinol-phosphate transaminase [Nocardioides sp. Soil796]|uniref:histidinol-phosphate transaminase n=1 Tax=Nocardioides sp. Soil796 TaxID=1736412 RepID=UPI000708F40C|nr:histidinol-phosphate transaminase [Nocardioides sp. Soil796]KRF16850.1 aminotransferase [Nocardioides sp. Soil796]